MTQRNNNNPNEETSATFRRPKLLNDLLKEKARSTLGIKSLNKYMEKILWQDVRELILEDLKGNPSSEALQDHVSSLLLEMKLISELTVEVNQRLAEQKALEAKAGKKKTAKKKTIKKSDTTKK